MSNVYVHFSEISFPTRYSVVNFQLESLSLRFREVIFVFSYSHSSILPQAAPQIQGLTPFRFPFHYGYNHVPQLPFPIRDATIGTETRVLTFIFTRRDYFMSSYVISCCSTADLTEEHFSKREISYICFHYKLNDTEYADDLGKSMPFDQFYASMAAGASTKTSQVNADEFEAYFETFLQDGKDILHVCLSSGISGVLNSAMIAKANLEERYPERKILIVDSLGASSGYGLLMDRLADLRDEGKPLEEVYDFAMKNRLKVHHWFFSTDLTFYVRGGRISKASGAIGGLLGICPLLNMDNEGRLIPRFKIRTKKKVIKKIVDQMEENAAGGLSYSGKCYISQSACYDDARAVADLVEERFPHLNGKVEINNIGTTIGSHTGPGTVALFFWGKERVD